MTSEPLAVAAVVVCEDHHLSIVGVDMPSCQGAIIMAVPRR